MARLKEMVGFLDTILRTRDIADDSNNGLQVEGKSDVRKIGFAVDACIESFNLAVKNGCDMLIVHHGISWKDSLKYLTAANYRRLDILFKHNISLYGSHLPLDGHEIYGNNIQICKAIGLSQIKQFGFYSKDFAVGFEGTLKGIRFEDFLKLANARLGTQSRGFRFGNDIVKRVAVVSGSGSDSMSEAAEKGIGTFITGDMPLHNYLIAKENKINVVCAGHYSTEVFGVKALMPLLQKKFGVKTVFLDESIEAGV